MVEAYLAQPTVGIDLVSGFGLLYLEALLHLVIEAHEVPLLGHDLVGEGSSSEVRLVVLLLVDSDEILTHLGLRLFERLTGRELGLNLSFNFL